MVALASVSVLYILKSLGARKGQWFSHSVYMFKYNENSVAMVMDPGDIVLVVL